MLTFSLRSRISFRITVVERYSGIYRRLLERDIPQRISSAYWRSYAWKAFCVPAIIHDCISETTTYHKCKDEEVLWHYTSLSSFSGMLKQRDDVLTSFPDGIRAEEIIRCEERGEEIFSFDHEGMPVGLSQQCFAVPMASRLSWANDIGEVSFGVERLNVDSDQSLKISHLSTSLNRDSVPLWLAYGDKGSGISVGLYSSLLCNVGHFTGPVLYEDKCIEMFSEKLNYWMSLLRGGADTSRGNVEAEEAIKFIGTVAACFVKNPRFSFESEVRSVQVGCPEMVFASQGQFTLRSHLHRLRRNLFHRFREMLKDSLVGDEFGFTEDELHMLDLKPKSPDSKYAVHSHLVVVGQRVGSREAEALKAMGFVRQKSECPLQ